jgi:hypothetical protein
VAMASGTEERGKEEESDFTISGRQRRGDKGDRAA